MRFAKDNSEPRPMEVWNAKVNFDGSDGAKNRPVIVLEKGNAGYVVFMVTSHGHHPETDIKLVDPYEVMLDKSSTVRTDRTFSVKRERFNYKLGDLAPDDVEMITMFYGRVRGGRRIKTDYVRSRIQPDDLAHVDEMVRYPFRIGRHREELRAHVQLANPLVEPLNMVLGHLIGDDVDLLLDVVCLLQRGLVVLGVSLDDLLVEPVDETLHRHDLADGIVGELDPVRLHLLGILHDVLGIIADALQVGYRMVDGGDVDLIPLAELVLRQFDEEPRDLLVEEVELLFVVAEALHAPEIELAYHVTGDAVVLDRHDGHVLDLVHDLLDGDWRCPQHVIVDEV